MAIPHHHQLVDGVRYALLALGLAGLGWLYAALAPRAAGETVASDASACRNVVAHRPRPDVAYAPGIGVRGESVVPADLGGAGFDIQPADLSIDLRLTLRDVAAGAQVGRVGDSEVRIGTLTFDTSGELLAYNGGPLVDPDEQAVREACQAALIGR